MAVLIVVAVACFSAGVIAAARWLPALQDGPVGAIAFFVICGLAGAALALIGINIDQIARQLSEHDRFSGGRLDEFVVSAGLVNILRDAGSIAAFALIAYVLAPKAPPESRSAPGPRNE
jgi:hypothetical protein